MEAELVEELPTGDWQYEPKWDGFRGVLENDGGELALWSRNERPLLRYFPELEPLGKLLPPHSALDGEIVISKKGQLDFDSMQLRLHPAESRIRKLSAEIPAQFIAFDILLWKGEKLHELPLEKRRKELDRKAKRFQLSPYSRDLADAERWLDRLEAAGLDGVVAKRLGAPYLPGSREGVVKVKKYKTADCVIVGYRYSEKAEGRISTLLLGLYDKDGELDFVGHCSGMNAAVRRQVEEELPKLRKQGFVSDKRIPGGQSRWTKGKRARLAAGQAQARRRGPLRQARAQPLPARDEAHPVPARQGPEGLHLARGPAPAPPRRPDRRLTPFLTGPGPVNPYGARPCERSVAEVCGTCDEPHSLGKRHAYARCRAARAANTRPRRDLSRDHSGVRGAHALQG